VTAGLPGTGIGGIFYLASALAMPLRAAYERLRGRPAGEWRVVRAQVAIAGGILGGMWGTGWLLGVAFAAAHRVIAPGAAMPASNVFRTASLALALGTLAGVLVGVELLRLWVHRGREREPLDREASLSRHKPVARREPSVVPGWRLVTLLLLVESAAAADPRIAMAQYPGAVAARLACADSAWAAGNMDVAAREYSAVVAADPDNSHATYRLAQLTRHDPAAALRLFRHYVTLEPSDPWGYMAVAEALARSGRYAEALRSYDDALQLAPGEQDAVAGRARVLARARAAGPAVTPLAGGSRDSDGNTTFRLGGSAELAELPARGMLRLGVEASRDRVANGVTTTGLDQLALRAAWRTPLARVEGTLGGTRLDAAGGGNPTVFPVGRVRARWRAPAGGPAVDFRAQRGVLAASPLLVANRVVRTELGALLEIPVAPALKLRGIGRTAILSDTADVNHRTTLGGVMAVALSPTVELSGQVHQMRYSHASAAGYFAPRLVQAVEAGSYVELETPRGVVLALDVGVGAQRVAEQGAPVGTWRRALRLYTFIVAPLAPGRTLQLELEGEDSSVAREGEGSAPTIGRWRYGSASLSLRWTLR